MTATKTRALVTWGGWEGHEPEKVAHIFRDMLENEGIEVELTDTLAAFGDAEKLATLDLIVPVWTMSTLSREDGAVVGEAIAQGLGVAGCHGGMCDAFRNNPLWQFITGANWVAHPGGDGVNYRVKITATDHELVAGIDDFDVSSEQYYLHVDPANEVLATTTTDVVTWYHSPNGPVEMPVAWTRKWGLGRVYYNALGHKANVIAAGAPYEMLRRGLVWAAGSRKAAEGQDLAPWRAEGGHY